MTTTIEKPNAKKQFWKHNLGSIITNDGEIGVEITNRAKSEQENYTLNKNILEHR